MDFNKIYKDMQKHGIYLIVSQINIHSVSISGTTGGLFNKSIFVSMSEYEFTNDNNYYDICLQIDGKKELFEIAIDWNVFAINYDLAFCIIRQYIKQSQIIKPENGGLSDESR